MPPMAESKRFIHGEHGHASGIVEMQMKHLDRWEALFDAFDVFGNFQGRVPCHGVGQVQACHARANLLPGLVLTVQVFHSRFVAEFA